MCRGCGLCGSCAVLLLLPSCTAEGYCPPSWPSPAAILPVLPAAPVLPVLLGWPTASTAVLLDGMLTAAVLCVLLLLLLTCRSWATLAWTLGCVKGVTRARRGEPGEVRLRAVASCNAVAVAAVAPGAAVVAAAGLAWSEVWLAGVCEAPGSCCAEAWGISCCCWGLRPAAAASSASTAAAAAPLVLAAPAAA